eukprot:2898909-Amphidinium_carterae.1
MPSLMPRWSDCGVSPSQVGCAMLESLPPRHHAENMTTQVSPNPRGSGPSGGVHPTDRVMDSPSGRHLSGRFGTVIIQVLLWVALAR